MVGIVDSKMLAYFALHGQKPIVSIFDALVGMLEQVEDNLQAKFTKIILVFDIGKSEYRLNLWSLYKDGRSYQAVPTDFKQTYEELIPQIAEALGIYIFPIDGVEADDLAGILAQKMSKDTVVLLSGDQDWYQLLYRRSDIFIFDIKKHSIFNSTTIKEVTGCLTEADFLIKKCIVGDSGDNIIGIPSVGPVKYKKWYETLTSHSMDYLKEEFIALCNSIKPENKTHSKYINHNIKSCEELLEFNLKLGTIMYDLSLLNLPQKLDIKHYYNLLDTSVFTPEVACTLVADKTKDYVNHFTMGYTISPITIDYFKEMHEQRRKK